MKNLILPLMVLGFGMVFSGSSLAQCPGGRIAADLRAEKKPYVDYELSATTKLYIQLDNSINSATYRTGDIIGFTVIENVYGRYVRKANNPNLNKLKLVNNAPVLVIPKKSKGYGRVNHSKRPKLFYYKGKSKIYVIPEYIQLEDGTCFEIVLPIPGGNFPPENIKPCKTQIVGGTKKNIRRINKTSHLTDQSKKRCIEGRRPKVFNSGVVKAGALGLLAVADDDNNDDRLSIGALTILSEGAEGLTDILSGKNAEIFKELIIEVQLSAAATGRVSYPIEKQKKP